MAVDHQGGDRIISRCHGARWGTIAAERSAIPGGDLVVQTMPTAGDDLCAADPHSIDAAFASREDPAVEHRVTVLGHERGNARDRV
jgi:hypothetical protein